jgi:hypothetical protein
VELQIHTPEDRALAIRLATLAHRRSLPVVASHAVYYLAPAQARRQPQASAHRMNRPGQ